jgi:tetratricopeptide (TPR) repeat protein
MAERIQEPEDEAGAGFGSANAGSAAAMAAALRRRDQGKADPTLDAFLEEQTRLARLQAEHLHEQRVLVLSRLRWGRFSDRLKAALQVMTALVGLAIVAVIGTMAWQAHEARGLVVDAFSVPPDLAQAGLTGQVAAARFLDKLEALQAASADSDRPAQSFQNNWDSEIKVEIPETGLTFGEFEKLLREKLGHISHVSGEVIRTPTGVTLTARMGQEPPQTFTGAPGDFDALAQQAAEAVYRQSQPYRYAEYLDEHGRSKEAFQVISDLATNGPTSERGWAFGQWALMDVNDHADVASARRHAASAMGYSPGSDIEAQIARVSAAVWSGDEETNLKLSLAIQVEAQRRQPDTSPLFFQENRLLSTAWLQFVQADYRAAAASWPLTANPNSRWTDTQLSMAMAATAFALDHDAPAARRAIAAASITDEVPLMSKVADGAFPAMPIYWLAVEAGDWPAALTDAKHVDAWLEANKSERPVYSLLQQVWIWPLEALAQARTGDLAGAQALIGRTASDCYLCLRVRGQMAAEARDWPAAERWFAEAVRLAPSSPFAYAEWGRKRLDRGDAQGAIAMLKLAHEKGPHFAEPLETWGEALMKAGDDAGAAAKFAEAAKWAPHWDRNNRLLALARAGGHG